MSLATKNGTNPAGVMVRLMLHDDEGFRLPAASRGVQVVSGLAWLTVAGEDIFLKNDSACGWLLPKVRPWVSALGRTPLILEVLGDSTSASATMESMVKNLAPTQGCVC
ncbi:MAG: hypothetical protein HC875_35985 [Anaerolineales bacterium]|nr:hypothetical protein [Anaerolineales bacterium]